MIMKYIPWKQAVKAMMNVTLITPAYSLHPWDHQVPEALQDPCEWCLYFRVGFKSFRMMETKHFHKPELF